MTKGDYDVFDYQGTDDVVSDFSTPSVAHEWPYANSSTRATVTTVPFSAYRFTVDGRKEQLWVTFEDLDGDNEWSHVDYEHVDKFIQLTLVLDKV